MSFPAFPNFRRISPLDQPGYLSWYKQNEPYSDFSFNNLCIWLDFNDDLEISRYKENLVLRFSNVFDENSPAYTLLGNTNCLATAEAVFKMQAKQGLTTKLTMVPESALNSMLTQNALPQDLFITVDIANRDYVYDVKTALAMQGPRYNNLRREIRVIKTRYPNLAVEWPDIHNPHTHQALLTALHAWSRDDYFARNDPRRLEQAAIERYLTLMDLSTTECLFIRDADKLVSFSIFHFPPQNDWVIVNHIKCDYTYEFLFNYTYYQLLKYFAFKHVRFVNFEQDLGILGLRYHKKLLKPASFLYRYELERF